MKNETLFHEKYNKLNKQQKEAVDTIDGPVMVIAGPGTGKTTILTLRIANILRQTDTPPSSILALTFTDAGVKAMKAKLREIIGTRADELRVHTFHGFASSIIAEFPEHFVHLNRSEQLTDIETESIIRDLLSHKKFALLRPLGDTEYYVSKIISAIGQCKKDAYTPEMVAEYAESEIKQVESDPESISKSGASKGKLRADCLKQIEKAKKTILFAEVYGLYEVYKREHRKMDFDDLLFELLQAMETDALLLQLLQEKFLYILVDEHQDTNNSQNNIITLLANFFDTPNIFVVGDEKQAIYRFQGASVENFLQFQKIWNDMKIIPLEQNYRSHQSILDATFDLIENNYEEGQYENLRVPLVSGAPVPERPVDVVYAENSNDGLAYCAHAIKEVLDTDPEASVAVIVHKNKEVDDMLALCQTSGIPATTERGVNIFTHPIGVMYFTLLQYIADPSQTESLAYSIAGGLWGLDFQTAQKLVGKIRSHEVSDVFAEIPALQTLQSELLKMGVISYLISVGELSGLTKMQYMSDPVAVEVWRAIIDLARDIAQSRNIHDPLTLISVLLDYKKTAETKIIKIGVGGAGARVRVMTAHSAKGLEYDYVVIPFATDESWMKSNKGQSFVLPFSKNEGDDKRDSRRLFYVALTRARKHVVIIVPEKSNVGKQYTELGFISELKQEMIQQLHAPQSTGMPQVILGSTLSDTRKSELIAYAQSILANTGLSVTALNHFLTCPSQFLYKSILKVPEAPNSTSEKGIAMHKALALVWKDGAKTKEKIEEIIRTTIVSFFSVSLLPKLDREIAQEELLASAPIVARELESHFNISGTVFAERWVESQYTVPAGQTLRLHGQMDAIITTPEKTLVFDYKTKQYMSENAIRGLTEGSDGKYFRQLVFYKILLSGNHAYNTHDIVPALVFIKPDDKGRCQTVTLPVTEEDVLQVKSDINTLVESVESGRFITESCDDVSCEYCNLKKLLQ